MHTFVRTAAVNVLAKHSLLVKDYDFILSSDSDMVYVQMGTIDSMLRLSNYLDSVGVKLAAVAAEQVGQRCHLDQGNIKTTIGEDPHKSYILMDNNEGIAGGSLLIKTSVWSEIGGYRAFNLYGSDDAHFMKDCSDRGYTVVIDRLAKVIHPPEKDPDYASWKFKSCRGLLSDEEREGYRFD